MLQNATSPSLLSAWGHLGVSNRNGLFGKTSMSKELFPVSSVTPLVPQVPTTVDVLRHKDTEFSEIDSKNALVNRDERGLAHMSASEWLSIIKVDSTVELPEKSDFRLNNQRLSIYQSVALLG